LDPEADANLQGVVTLSDAPDVAPSLARMV
jgi:hypothetical protein